MARRRKAERVLGPYRDGRGYRIIISEGPNQKRRLYFETARKARRAKEIAEQELRELSGVTIKEAVTAYEMFQLHEKHDKLQSARDTGYRLGLFLADGEEFVSSLTPLKCQALFANLKARNTKYGKPFAVDSILNIMAECKTFVNWCVEKKWLRMNPLAGLKVLGKRRHGRLQLRLDEARRWTARALELARTGAAGAVAALVALFMGMRASEIINRLVRDLDDDGRILVVENAKTPAGNRRLQVPEILRPFLMRLAEGKAPGDLLFDKHLRDWVREWVVKICKEVKVPVVCAHSMRGLHSTLAMEAGMSSQVVAASMGHESSKTTLQSYATPEGVISGRTKKVTAGLLGKACVVKSRRNIVPVSFRNENSSGRRRRKYS